MCKIPILDNMFWWIFNIYNLNTTPDKELTQKTQEIKHELNLIERLNVEINVLWSITWRHNLSTVRAGLVVTHFGRAWAGVRMLLWCLGLRHGHSWLLLGSVCITILLVQIIPSFVQSLFQLINYKLNILGWMKEISNFQIVKMSIYTIRDQRGKWGCGSSSTQVFKHFFYVKIWIKKSSIKCSSLYCNYMCCESYLLLPILQMAGWYKLTDEIIKLR